MVPNTMMRGSFWAAAGCVVHHLVCTDGSKGTWNPDAELAELVATRRDEQREAARQATIQGDDTSSKDEAALDLDEPVVDIDALSGDSLRLLNLTIALLAALGKYTPFYRLLFEFDDATSLERRQHAVGGRG